MIDYKEKYYQIIDKLKTLITEYYGERLISIVLYGSVGRDKYTPESDIDILVVVSDLPKGRSNRFFEYYNNVDVHIQQDFNKLQQQGINAYLSPMLKTIEEVKYGSPLFIEMADECKILYDKDDFFFGILENLKAKLKQLGSEKVYFKGKYYWRLKPDYKWGDIIEL